MSTGQVRVPCCFWGVPRNLGDRLKGATSRILDQSQFPGFASGTGTKFPISISCDELGDWLLGSTFYYYILSGSVKISGSYDDADTGVTYTGTATTSFDGSSQFAPPNTFGEIGPSVSDDDTVTFNQQIVQYLASSFSVYGMHSCDDAWFSTPSIGDRVLGMVPTSNLTGEYEYGATFVAYFSEEYGFVNGTTTFELTSSGASNSSGTWNSVYTPSGGSPITDSGTSSIQRDDPNAQIFIYDKFPDGNPYPWFVVDKSSNKVWISFRMDFTTLINNDGEGHTGFDGFFFTTYKDNPSDDWVSVGSLSIHGLSETPVSTDLYANKTQLNSPYTTSSLVPEGDMQVDLFFSKDQSSFPIKRI